MRPTKIEGLGALRSGFKDLGTDMELRTSRLMVASAGGVLRAEARRLAREQGLRLTGALIKNIVIKRERTPPGVAQYNLGVRHGRALGKKAGKKLVVGKSGRVQVQYLDDPFYWWFLENGRNVYAGNGRRVANGRTKTGRPAKGEQANRRNGVGRRVPATPYIAPALENKRLDAIEAMGTRLAAAILKANSK